MSTLVTHTNGISQEMFGELTETDGGHGRVTIMPVAATPASAVALGVAVGAVAFHAGYMVGIARNMAEGKYPQPK